MKKKIDFREKSIFKYFEKDIGFSQTRRVDRKFCFQILTLIHFTSAS